MDEAFQQLEQGHYITSVPYEVTDMERVGKVELVYRNARTEETFLPYYRFYVALPEEQKDGLTTFGAYYVPAVQEAYIANILSPEGQRRLVCCYTLQAGQGFPGWAGLQKAVVKATRRCVPFGTQRRVFMGLDRFNLYP